MSSSDGEDFDFDVSGSESDDYAPVTKKVSSQICLHSASFAEGSSGTIETQICSQRKTKGSDNDES